MKNNKWTDQDMIDFAKVAMKGQYGDYDGCKSTEDKFNRFKELSNIKYAPSIVDAKAGDFIKLCCDNEKCTRWIKALVLDEHLGIVKIVSTEEIGDLRNQSYFCPTHIKK
jgi:hypothetical protein